MSSKLHQESRYDQKVQLMNIDIFGEMATRWGSPVIARAEVKKFTGGGAEL